MNVIIAPIFTIDDYNALKLAIASGEKRVKYSDKETEYRSLAEMLAILRMMETDLGVCNSGIGRRTYAVTSKGLC